MRQVKPCSVCGRVRSYEGNHANVCASCRYFAKAVRPGDWVDQAACATVDPELFWLEDRHKSQQAQEVCMTCPVIAECLAYAIETNQTQGIWGGLTPSGRNEYARMTEAV